MNKMFHEHRISQDGLRNKFESIDEDEEEDDEPLKSRRDSLNAKARFLWGRFKSKIMAATTLKNIANAILVICVSAICFDQCSSQINEYLEYETRLQVLHTHPVSTLWLIPGITICSNNRIRMNRLIQRVPILRDIVNDVVNRSAAGVEDIALLNEQKRVNIMRQIKEAVDEVVDMSALISESTIPTLMRMSSYPMIRDINCNGLWGRQFNCENFEIIESYQNGYCNTLFHRGSILKALASGKIYDFNTSLLGGKQKIESFDAFEVAEIIVEFEPLNHGDFKHDIGGKLVIHSTDHIGSVRDMAHLMLPGNSYSVITKRTVSKRLPPPYKSMCHDYRAENEFKFASQEGAFASTELDSTTCVRNCIVRQTTRDCNCWPVEVPYFEGDPMINGSESFRLCAWTSENANENSSAALYVDCYKRFHTSCRKECKATCRIEDFHVHVMNNPWPTVRMFLRASSEQEKKEFHRLKGRSARISLKYLEFLENRHVMSPSITLAQLVSNLGGIVSALIGVSLLTIYRYLTRDILRCKVVSDYMPSSRLAPNKNSKARQVFNRAKSKLLDVKAALPSQSYRLAKFRRTSKAQH